MEQERKGKFFIFLDKTSDLVILGLIWIITSLPAVTAGASAAALYHAVCAAVRQEEGNPVTIYWSAWKENLKKGSILTLCYSLTAISLTAAARTAATPLLTGLTVLAAAVLLCSGFYCFPLLSRFDLKIMQYVQASIFFAVHYFGRTGLLLTTFVLCALVFCIFPFLLPVLIGAFSWYSSFLLEGLFREYAAGTEAASTLSGKGVRYNP